MIVFGKERDYVIHNDKKINGFFGEYRFLSNFHVCPFWFEGRVYESREHAYQAAKYSPEERHIFDRVSSAEAKKLGRKAVVNLERWNESKYNIMATVVLSQFAAYPVLAQELLKTGDKYLEESNHWGDMYWGVYYPENWKAFAPKGKGENKLGKILMHVRALLLDK